MFDGVVRAIFFELENKHEVFRILIERILYKVAYQYESDAVRIDALRKILIQPKNQFNLITLVFSNPLYFPYQAAFKQAAKELKQLAGGSYRASDLYHQRISKVPGGIITFFLDYTAGNNVKVAKQKLTGYLRRHQQGSGWRNNAELFLKLLSVHKNDNVFLHHLFCLLIELSCRPLVWHREKDTIDLKRAINKEMQFVAQRMQMPLLSTQESFSERLYITKRFGIKPLWLDVQGLADLIVGLAGKVKECKSSFFYDYRRTLWKLFGRITDFNESECIQQFVAHLRENWGQTSSVFIKLLILLLTQGEHNVWQKSLHELVSMLTDIDGSGKMFLFLEGNNPLALPKLKLVKCDENELTFETRMKGCFSPPTKPTRYDKTTELPIDPDLSALLTVTIKYRGGIYTIISSVVCEAFSHDGVEATLSLHGYLPDKPCYIKYHSFSNLHFLTHSKFGYFTPQPSPLRKREKRTPLPSYLTPSRNRSSRRTRVSFFALKAGNNDYVRRHLEEALNENDIHKS